MGTLRCVHLNRRLRCGDLPATAVTKICLMDACFAQPTSYPPGRQPWPRWPTMSGRRRLAGAELGTGPNCRRENCKARASPRLPAPYLGLTWLTPARFRHGHVFGRVYTHSPWFARSPHRRCGSPPARRGGPTARHILRPRWGLKTVRSHVGWAKP